MSAQVDLRRSSGCGAVNRAVEVLTPASNGWFLACRTQMLDGVFWASSSMNDRLRAMNPSCRNSALGRVQVWAGSRRSRALIQFRQRAHCGGSALLKVGHYGIK